MSKSNSRSTVNVRLLAEGSALIRSMPVEIYAEPVIDGSSPIGAHVRHVLDHYDCLLHGLEGGRVDYTRRSRDKVTEVDPATAIRRTDEVTRAIEALGDRDAPLSVPTTGELDRDGGTTIARELDFLASHTLHHYAIIAVLCGAAGYAVPEGFGVAPATQGSERGR